MVGYVNNSRFDRIVTYYHTFISNYYFQSTNGEPFANTDAAFRLAYATIMLNMDQHNHSAKKLNVPMNVSATQFSA